MGTVYRKTATKPLPKDVELFTRKGQRFARWMDGRGRKRTALVTTGRDGSERIVIEAKTYTAKYRDGGRIVREVATGCRDRQAALSVLADLERRAELVKAGVMSTAEDTMADHQDTPLLRHLDAYGSHLAAKGVAETWINTTKQRFRKVATGCGFKRLAGLSGEALERWLVAQQDAGMSAGSRNGYRKALVSFGNWCVRTGRLKVNPFGGVPKADERIDPKRQRRALTEDELSRLLIVARKRPLAERGRETMPKPEAEQEGRKTWTYIPLTADSLDTARERARERLKDCPETVAQLEALGRERALIYKALVLTGLRKGELASLTVGQLALDGRVAYAVLDPADEKARRGAEIALRGDLRADLRKWLADKLQALQRDAVRSGEPVPSRLPADLPVFDVPDDLSKVLDRDLKVAGIPKRDERGRTVDVHAFRHTFGTYLSKGGVPLRTAQAAMRHSTPDLTANVYTDPKLLDVAGALSVLPNLSVDGDDEGERQRATGTADASAQFAPAFAPNAGEPCISRSSADPTGDVLKKAAGAESLQILRGNGDSQGNGERPRQDSNLQPLAPEANALSN